MFTNNHLSNKQIRQLTRDLAITLLSVILAISLVRSGFIHDLVALTRPFAYVTELLAGVLFTSTFTTPLAIATFLELGQEGFNPYLTALVGGVGAVIGDLLIFKFVKDELSEDLMILARGLKRTFLGHVFRSKLFYWLTPIIASLIIASPFPDEIGIGMLGAIKIDRRLFIVISFSLNTLGILAILLLGKL